MFATAREAAGTGDDVVPGATVGAVLAAARERYGDDFSRVLAGSMIWRNGEPVELDSSVSDGDEIAVLPPVSGGCA